eukprot:4453306-Heterocapsa_arctica.AAC.1
MVYPCAKALPMGFSWGLYFCQHANERTASLAPGVGQREPVTDRGRLWSFILVTAREVNPRHSETLAAPCSITSMSITS